MLVWFELVFVGSPFFLVSFLFFVVIPQRVIGPIFGAMYHQRVLLTTYMLCLGFLCYLLAYTFMYFVVGYSQGNKYLNLWVVIIGVILFSSFYLSGQIQEYLEKQSESRISRDKYQNNKPYVSKNEGPSAVWE